jgi:hypothetical protein
MLREASVFVAQVAMQQQGDLLRLLMGHPKTAA